MDWSGGHFSTGGPQLLPISCVVYYKFNFPIPDVMVKLSILNVESDGK
jgi:hypothetical protein